MPIIKSLPPEVAARIAAGEVVERPASVVKELVENAIDAGATHIAVAVDEGGRACIAVTDDGCGMDAEDAARALERYATSKIAREEDLWRLATMGFRGEALHAIAAVSRLTIETRTRQALEGTRVATEGGVDPRLTAVGCPVGTRIEVRDLFFNTPARQKFLKSASVEFGHISEDLLRAALAHPSIAFELSHNGKKTWAYPAACEGAERMSVIAARDECARLVAFAEEGYGCAVRGWVGDEMLTRASPKDVHVFVNRRPVRDRVLMHAITAAYESSLDRGRFPVAAVFLECDPATVDVNVHPTKREVRFAHGSAVHDFVQASVRKALHARRQTRAFGAAPSQTTPSAMSAGADRAAVLKARVQHALDRFDARSAEVVLQRETAQDAALPKRDCASPQGALLPHAHEPTLRTLGQLDETFVVCADRAGALVVIDQHAAHERLGYDELMRQYREGGVAEQRLLFPQTVTLSPAQRALVPQVQEVLAQAGFDVEPFGGNEIVIKAVPALVGEGNLAPLFEKLFHEMQEVGSMAALDEKLVHIFSVIACHRQVRAGDALTAEEMQRLADDITAARTDSCPHGRPALVRFTRGEIEKWFKRN